MEWINRVVVQTVVKVIEMVIATISKVVTAIVNQVVSSLTSFAGMLGADITVLNTALLRSIVKMALLMVTTGVAAALTGSGKLLRAFEALVVVFVLMVVFVSFSIGTWLQGLIFGSALLLLAYGTLVAASAALGQDAEDPTNLARVFQDTTSDLVRDSVDFTKDLGSRVLGLPDWPAWVWWAIGGTVGYVIFIKD